MEEGGVNYERIPQSGEKVPLIGQEEVHEEVPPQDPKDLKCPKFLQLQKVLKLSISIGILLMRT